MDRTKFVLLPVFVADCCVPDAKRKTWIKRKDEHSRFVGALFKCLSTRGQPHPSQYDRCPSPRLQVVHILRDMLDCEVVLSVDKDADELVAEMARDTDAVAILAQDSDFIAYQVDSPYLSVRHLDLETLETCEYDRNGVATALGLTVPQLPLLAILNGNDLFSKEDLKPFHDRLTGSDTLQKVADFIKSMEPECYSYETIFESLPSITEEVFGSQERLKDAQRAINGYFLKGQPVHEENGDEAWMEIKSTFKQSNISILKILHHGVWDQCIALQDPSVQSPPTSRDFYSKFRRRIYGVLLSKKPGTDRAVREWIPAGPGSLERAVCRDPIPPPPALEGLLPRLANRHDVSRSTIQHRWEMLTYLTSLAPDVPAQKLKTLTIRRRHLVSLLCQLYVMQHPDTDSPEDTFPNEPVLYDWEVKIFIIQHLVLLNKEPEDLSGLKVEYLRPRAVSLAALYTSCPLYLAFIVSGYPVEAKDFLLVNTFNGKLFQSLYYSKMAGLSIDTIVRTQGLDKNMVQTIFDVVTTQGRFVKASESQKRHSSGR